jgi:RNA polymerase sigma factor (sigma-70 family)
MTANQMSETLQHLRNTALFCEGAGLTDGQLLESYLNRHNEATLATLVRRHGPMVWGVCRRILGNHHDAEDAFQATFLVFVRKAASIVSPALLANWLYGVAYQTALNARAASVKRKGRERQVAEMPEPEMVQQDLWRDLQPVLDRELKRLPDKYRIPIILCDLEGKTRTEAARHLGCPEGTVAGRLARAREMLAKRLSRHGIALSAGTLAAILTQNTASASVPAAVVSSTIKAANAFAAGEAAASGVISAQAVALTERVLKTMLLTKLKIATAVLLVLLLAGIGVSKLTSDVDAQKPPAKTGKTPKETWKEAGTLVGHEKPVLCLAFGPGSVLITGDKSGQVRVWDTAAKKSLRDFKNGGFKKGPAGRPITGITYAADDTWVSFREKNAAHLAFGKMMKDGKPLTFGKGIGGDSFSPLAMTSDAKTYAVRKNDSPDILIEETDLKDLRPKIINPNDLIWCKGHEKAPTCAAFAADDTLLVTGSPDKSARLWDAVSGAARHTLSGHTDAVLAVAFSPDGTLVATGSRDGLVKVWDVKTGKETASLKGHTVVRAVAFAPDCKTLASGGEDEAVRIWNAKTGAELAVLRNHKGTVLTVAFSRDGALLASGADDNTVRLWKRK